MAQWSLCLHAYGVHVECIGGQFMGHGQDGNDVDGDNVSVQTTVLGHI